MNEVMERTPIVIAAEIRSLQDQAKRMALYHAVEIGNRLIEVKALLVHGNWGTWLEENVSYSQRTAQNLMRLAEGYGGGAGLLAEGVNSQAFADLDMTKAIALLALPPAQREAFLEENDVREMSSRELEQAIRDRDEAKSQASSLEAQLDRQSDLLKRFEADEKELRGQLDAMKKQHETELSKAAADARATGDKVSAQHEVDLKKEHARKLGELEKKLAAAQQKVNELTEQATQPAAEPVVVETVPEDVLKELDGLRESKKQLEAKLGKAEPAALKFTMHFEALSQTFKLLLSDLAEMGATDQEKKGRYKGALDQTIDRMKTSVQGI